MTLITVSVCYSPTHQPLASDGAVKVQNLNSERPALKIIRAVLRDSDIDPQDAVNYSLHRCYCRFKIKIEDDDEDESFNPESTLDELEIEEGDSVFIRKIDDRVEEMEEEQGSTLRRSSRKRKEADYNEDDHCDGTSESIFTVTSTSNKRRSPSIPSRSSAAVDKVSSNLENLSTNAAATARSISKLLGGDGWKSQSVGKFGKIQTRSQPALSLLVRLAKTSLEIPQLSNSDRTGLFNSDLIEALTRAYHQRVGSSVPKTSQRNFFDLGLSDYEHANQLLKGKIEENGSWERSSISHVDKTTLSKPAERFSLSDSGLSGRRLNVARHICILWDNDKWLNQAPLPGLSPISLRAETLHPTLRQIAQLTRVKPGRTTPDGFPPIVLRALKDSIKKNENVFESNRGGAQGGWAQRRCIPDALAILKKREAITSSIASSNPDLSSEDSGDRDSGKRNVRPRLEAGN